MNKHEFVRLYESIDRQAERETETNRRTEMTKPSVAFRKFANASKIIKVPKY